MSSGIESLMRGNSAQQGRPKGSQSAKSWALLPQSLGGHLAVITKKFRPLVKPVIFY